MNFMKINTWGVFIGIISIMSIVYATPKSSLVDIQKINPRIRIDLKYATPDNFTHQIVYDFNRCCLLEHVARALSDVQQELEIMGLGLKIWDGYRPMYAQWKFWELVPDERYVLDPRKGGRHPRGTTVDLTLVDKDGNELEMPTEFDNFTEKAHRNYMDVSEQAIKNRKLLQTVMEKHGFTGIQTEWWHFDYQGWQECPPLDVDVNKLP